MGKLAIVASVGIGIAIFALLISLVGFDSILAPFQNFSISHLLLFLLTAALLYLVSVYRWAAILKYKGIRAPFSLLVRYKIIGSAVNYVTPAARMGGEPVKAVLFKRKLKLKEGSAMSSILLETTLGASIDILFFSVLLAFTIIFLAIPYEAAILALMVSLGGLLLLVIFFSTLIRRKGPISALLRLAYSVFRLPVLRSVLGKIRAVEEQMTDFLLSRKKGVLEAFAISMFSWPLIFLQYKFALLSIGYDASFAIILLSIVATTIAASIPIPAAFGVQEASQFSVFSIVAAANVGFALSLLLRFKDLIVTLLGFILLSHEGLNIIEVLRKKRA